MIPAEVCDDLLKSTMPAVILLFSCYKDWEIRKL